jgi:hypothetical protein
VQRRRERDEPGLVGHGQEGAAHALRVARHRALRARGRAR